MKTIATLAVVACISCSRQTGTAPLVVADREPPIGDASTERDGVIADAVGASDAASPVRSADRANAVMLPYTTPTDNETGFSLAMDIAAGQLPNSKHPSGTVYAVQPGEKVPYPLTVTEWDLAHGQAVRSRAVSPDGGAASAASSGWNALALGAGGRLHLAAYRWNEDLYYLELDPSLQVITREHLGTVTVYGPSAIESDGSLTVFLAGMSVERHPHPAIGSFFENGYYAATYDSRGRRIARRFIVPFEDETHDSGGFKDNAAIVNGKIYVLEGEGSGARIVELTPALTEVARRSITTACDYQQATLRARGDHLLVDTGDQRLEVSLDLSRVDVVSAAPIQSTKTLFNADRCGRRITMGSVLAKLCWCEVGPCITWERR